jgi:hypothetical protein
MPRILLFLFLLPVSAIAQKKFNLTLFGGFSNYSGDLQEKRFTLQQAHKAFGAGLSLQLRPKFFIHGTLKKGQISASDKFSSRQTNRDRNLSFVSNIYEASLTAEYTLQDLYYDKWTPYVFGGLAIFRFNPGASGQQLRLLSTEGQGFVPGREPYRILTISVPLGFGIRVKINDNTYLGYEIGIRKTFTDYLDDVSTTYVDQNVLLQNRGQTAVNLAFRGDEIKSDLTYPAAGSIRGSEKYKDWYYFSGITLSLGLTNADGKLFGKKVKRGSVDCPPRVL